MKKYIAPKMAWADLDSDSKLCQTSGDPDATISFTSTYYNEENEILVKGEKSGRFDWDNLW